MLIGHTAFPCHLFHPLYLGNQLSSQVVISVASICASSAINTQSDTWSLAIQRACGYSAGQLCSVLKYITSYFDVTCTDGDFRVPSTVSQLAKHFARDDPVYI